MPWTAWLALLVAPAWAGSGDVVELQCVDSEVRLEARWLRGRKVVHEDVRLVRSACADIVHPNRAAAWRGDLLGACGFSRVRPAMCERMSDVVTEALVAVVERSAPLRLHGLGSGGRAGVVRMEWPPSQSFAIRWKGNRFTGTAPSRGWRPARDAEGCVRSVSETVSGALGEEGLEVEQRTVQRLRCATPRSPWVLEVVLDGAEWMVDAQLPQVSWDL